ncbi:ABC transporter permease [Fictibacillus nanhaiensis]|uniref:ABC transporter permease n=1 Tax=Fictibacillus nanhaiensis TaxID=742169 RepID=UPI002E1EF9BD|nr:ABC transporter permease [Fictibacillus nanhaiensis]
MNTFQYLLYNTKLSWRMQRNELPLKIFIGTFAIRIIFQSLFFIWVATVIGGDEMREFAMYGNILIPAAHILFIDVYNVLRDEIDENRIDLLTLSKTSLLMILIGRSLVYFVKAFFIILFTYAIISSILIPGLWHWLKLFAAIPLLLLFSLSAYSFGIFLASLNLNDKISQMLPNFSLVFLMLVGNFTVPVESLPKFLQTLSQFVPLRHSVDAFRDFMTNNLPYWTNPSVYLELIILTFFSVVGYSVYLKSLDKFRKQPV